MLHGYLGDAKFWRILLRIDADLAEEVRSVGCPHCRSVLHSARYPRKPRRGGSRRTRLRLRVSAESGSCLSLKSPLLQKARLGGHPCGAANRQARPPTGKGRIVVQPPHGSKGGRTMAEWRAAQ